MKQAEPPHASGTLVHCTCASKVPYGGCFHADMASVQHYLDLQHCRVPRLGLNNLAAVGVSKCLVVCLIDCQPALRPPPAPAGNRIYCCGRGQPPTFPATCACRSSPGKIGAGASTHQSLFCTMHVFALVPDLDLTLLEASGSGTLLSLLQRHIN